MLFRLRRSRAGLLRRAEGIRYGKILDDLPRPRRRPHLVENAAYARTRAQVLEFLYARLANPALAA